MIIFILVVAAIAISILVYLVTQTHIARRLLGCLLLIGGIFLASLTGSYTSLALPVFWQYHARSWLRCSGRVRHMAGLGDRGCSSRWSWDSTRRCWHDLNWCVFWRHRWNSFRIWYSNQFISPCALDSMGSINHPRYLFPLGTTVEWKWRDR